MLKRLIIGVPLLTLAIATLWGAYPLPGTVVTWHPKTKVFDSTSTAQHGSYFGTAVAVDGDPIVVGATDYLIGNARAGAAFVYTRAGSTWVEQAKLLCSPIRYGCSNFGRSVAISGNTIAVTAMQGSGGVGSPDFDGAIYVFTRYWF
jgi:hypothetical protein